MNCDILKMSLTCEVRLSGIRLSAAAFGLRSQFLNQPSETGENKENER